ncbi:hypothetical protein LPU83_pLPU83d_1161 (plasmid) [Rhizobium favelukesii]|uniref:Uncharacterized protein n=1 Tax=Rhizobium favelukesii TaxID=348824 RepID=W6S8T7_9HYPH|nr:hypothetical protein LPU83_pLPU83d_1161 [Rhizobium favelukesii]
MSVERFPIGQEMDVTYPNFKVSQTLLSVTQLRSRSRKGRSLGPRPSTFKSYPLATASLLSAGRKRMGRGHERSGLRSRRYPLACHLG